MLLVSSLAIFMLISCSVAVQTQEEGDLCVYHRLQVGGVCKKGNDCPYATDLYHRKRVVPQLCSFGVNTPIVCCPDVESTTKKPVSISTSTHKSTWNNRFTSTRSSIAEKKCLEYSQYVYSTAYSPLIGEEDVTVKVDECGTRKTDLIFGGEKAEDKQFPHMAALGCRGKNNEFKFKCGATIISENFILTAAHCPDLMKCTISVRVGERSLSAASPRLQEFNVDQVHKHPDYDHGYNDIALLKLERNIEFDGYARPICLNTKRERDEKTAIAAGWGRTENVTTSDELMHVTLSLKKRDCDPIFEEYLMNGVNYTTQFCAGLAEGKDTCSGDSGGSLQVDSPTHYCMYEQIGITSLGHRFCGTVSGLYTRVSYYIDWIESIVWKDTH